MDDLLAERNALIAERDALEQIERTGGTLTEAERQELRETRGAINARSRQLGETAAQDAMEAEGRTRVYPRDEPVSTAGDFDSVYVGEENGQTIYYAVEEKGGSARLSRSGRLTEGGVRAEQGSSRYADSIIDAMMNSNNEETREMGELLAEARQEGRVRYVMVRAPIGRSGGAPALRNIKISELALSPVP